MRPAVIAVPLLVVAAASSTAAQNPPREKPRSALSREVCHLPEQPEQETEGAIEAAGALADRSRRRLYQTACAANLWMDGLFGGTPEQFAATIDHESAKWGKVIKAAGIRLD